MCEEDQTKNQRMTLDEFRRQVVQCLMRLDGLTEAEAENLVSENLDYQLADGVKTGAELLLELYEDRLLPLTAAEVLMEL